MSSEFPTIVNQQMQRFRLASRDVWNNYILPSTRDVPKFDAYCWPAHIQQELYASLVLWPAGFPDVRYGDVNLSLKVNIVSQYGAPAMINRAIDSGYWDHPVDRLGPEADLRFRCYFDWDESGILDHQYARVAIVAHPQPDIVGKDALIEVQYVTFSAG